MTKKGPMSSVYTMQQLVTFTWKQMGNKEENTVVILNKLCGNFQRHLSDIATFSQRSSPATLNIMQLQRDFTAWCDRFTGEREIRWFIMNFQIVMEFSNFPGIYIQYIFRNSRKTVLFFIIIIIIIIVLLLSLLT